MFHAVPLLFPQWAIEASVIGESREASFGWNCRKNGASPPFIYMASNTFHLLKQGKQQPQLKNLESQNKLSNLGSN